MRVLLVGWFSVTGGEATAGDVLSVWAVETALAAARVDEPGGLAHAVTEAAEFSRRNVVIVEEFPEGRHCTAEAMVSGGRAARGTGSATGPARTARRQGRVVHCGGTIAFLEGSLRDAEGHATATAAARVVRTEPPGGSPP